MIRLKVVDSHHGKSFHAAGMHTIYAGAATKGRTALGEAVFTAIT